MPFPWYPQLFTREGLQERKGDAATTSAPKTRARSEANVNISKDSVLKVACNYEGYADLSFDPRIKVRTGIANTLDTTAYDVASDLQKELYAVEIDRLLSALARDIPRTFRGSTHLQADTQAAYETMTSLSNQMWTAFLIITHDTELTVRSHFPLLHHEELLQHTRQNLSYLTKQDGDESEEEEEDNENSKGGEDKMPGLSALNYEGNREDYFELVDYTTEIVSRVLLKCAYGGEWNEGILACMAKLSVKMKVLSANLEEFAATSLTKTPAILKQTVPNKLSQSVEGQYTGRGGPIGNLDAMLQSVSADESRIALAGANEESKRHALVQLYWVDTMRVQETVRSIFRTLLLSLRGVRRTKATSKTSYELCAMVYHTGFEDFPTMVYQDMDGDYNGSSRQVNINTSQSAFEVLNTAIRNVLAARKRPELPGEHHRPPSSSSGVIRLDSKGNRNDNKELPPASIDGQKLNTRVGTTVSWNYIDMGASTRNSPNEPETPSVMPIADAKPKTDRLESMNEILTVLVPLIVLNPHIIENMTDLVGLMVRTSQPAAENDAEHVRPYTGTQFKAFFCLTTDEYATSRTRAGHSASSQLSKSLMTRDKLIAGKAGEDIPEGTILLQNAVPKGAIQKGTLPFVVDGSFSNQQVDKQEQLERWEQEIRDAKRKMSEWVFEEGGVRVSCGLYVWGVLTVAATLVGGGIASGLTIQTRIQGVDPFNIATFTWVVAGFIILIAKSTRVESWSWRDFLHR